MVGCALETTRISFADRKGSVAARGRTRGEGKKRGEHATMTWAVVTGAANGIGAVIAEHAAKAGFSVSGWGIDAAKLSDLAERVSRITPQHIDVTTKRL